MIDSEETQMSVQDTVEVLVDCPGAQGLYTYRIPRDLYIEPGDILSVPFGARQVGAIAIRFIAEGDLTLTSSQIRNIEDVISRGFFSKAYWQLLERVADYYQTPLIQVIRTALPTGLLAKSQRRIRLISNNIPAQIEPLISLPAQKMLRRLQQSSTGDYTWQYLQRNQPGAHKALKQLLDHHWVESYLSHPQPPQAKHRQAVTVIADLQNLDTDSALTSRQREILLTLIKQGGELWLSDALQRLRTTSTTLQKLKAKGYLTIQPREILRVSSHSQAGPDQPKTLTPDQANALNTLNRCTNYAQILLHGVTGSGKTEVYLQAIAPRLTHRQSILVLVPEIGLTPQLTDRFRSRFGDQVCVYHSGLSTGERYDTWRQMLTGAPQIVIGTRSAIFSPLPNLGLIILDEEHDSSFKQDQPAPCYHARKVAQWRAELADCPLVLGSATPSLESWLIAQSSPASPASPPLSLSSPKGSPTPHPPPPSHYLPLPTRVHTRPLPPVEIIDMRAELHNGNRTIFSRSLQIALETMKSEGKQGLLFIHRRGHSRFVSCRSCGYVVECPNCDVSLAYHQPHPESTPYLSCHYCGYRQGQPSECPDCQSPYLKHFGSGTQRIVNDLTKYFPEVRCIRFDSDTTRTKGAHRALLTRFADGEADLLVGTQMLTKGIDLPQITVVGVIAADGLLHMADYWAGERAFQTLTQVAGRAGRGQHPGKVIVQTYTPDHFVIEAVKTHHYPSFISQELEHRQALNYPPFGRLILLRLSSLDPVQVEKAAEKYAMTLENLTHRNQGLSPGVTYEVLGPVPAPILRVAQRYRWHVLLKLPLESPLPDLTTLRQTCPKGVSLTIDVDPLNLA